MAGHFGQNPGSKILLATYLFQWCLQLTRKRPIPMLLPSVEQYAAAIKKKDPEDFSFLNDYTILPGNDNEPASFFCAGSSAAIFRASKDSKNYAIRFFLNAEPEIFHRWQQISSFLGSEKVSWKVDFDYIDREVFI